MEKNTDYIVYDRANNRVLMDSQGEVIYFASKQEAVDNLYANEEVLLYTEYLDLHNNFGLPIITNK